MRTLLLTASIVGTLTANAQALDFGQVLLDVDGTPIHDDFVKENPPPLTLGLAAYRALILPQPEDQNEKDDEKYHRGELAFRLHAGGNFDLSPEDLAMIKKRIGRVYNAVVTYRVFPMLDPTMGKKK